MVRPQILLATLMMASTAVVTVGCFDPVVPAECTGAVCGEVMEDDGAGGAGGVVSMGGMGGNAGHHSSGGHAGHAGHMGGMGGSGGAGPLTIQITNPTDGSSVSHGMITFTAVVTGGSPPNDTIRWEKSGVPGIFGIGYTHTKAVNNTGAHTLTASVMQGDTPIANDTIQFDTF